MLLPQPPILDQLFSALWTTYFKQAHPITNSVTDSGITANRPTTDLWIGRQYYDTTLNKPVYLNSVGPNVWKDSAGTTV